MTAKRHRVPPILLVIVLTTAVQARGSFERLPGPAPGGNGGWVWDWPVRPRHASGARLSIGNPAAVDGLGWSHARARASIAHFRIEADAYLLGLDDLYRETAAGVWCGRGILTVGARRWDIAWKDDARRAGWTLSAGVASRIGGVDVDIAAQDLPLGRRESCAPPSRFGGGAEYGTSPFLRIGGDIFRDPSGPGCLAHVRWAPVPEISFREAVRAPGGILESGVELRAGGTTVGLWLEPSVGLGTRIGISCAFE
jgi:hypothetical protein